VIVGSVTHQPEGEPPVGLQTFEFTRDRLADKWQFPRCVGLGVCVLIVGGKSSPRGRRGRSWPVFTERPFWLKDGRVAACSALVLGRFARVRAFHAPYGYSKYPTLCPSEVLLGPPRPRNAAWDYLGLDAMPGPLRPRKGPNMLALGASPRDKPGPIRQSKPRKGRDERGLCCLCGGPHPWRIGGRSCSAECPHPRPLSRFSEEGRSPQQPRSESVRWVTSRGFATLRASATPGHVPSVPLGGKPSGPLATYKTNTHISRQTALTWPLARPPSPAEAGEESCWWF